MPYRSRDRSQWQQTGQWRSFVNGELHSEYPEDACRLPLTGEIMNDHVNNKEAWNPVSHSKFNNLPGTPDPFLLYDQWNPFATPQVIVYAGTYLPYQAGTVNTVVPHDLNQNVGFLPDGEAGQFSRAALDKALDQIPESVSIANFLLELRDVKNLLPRWNGWKTGSDQFLNWNFGWHPLIQDTKKLLTVVADVRKRLEHLKRINHRLVTLSHQKKFVLVDDSSPPEYGPGSAPDGTIPFPTSFKVQYHEVHARINLQVYTALDFGGADDFLKAMCSALGLMNPLLIVWNAIPFSFVVDWFVNLSGWLDQHAEIQPFKGTITLEGVDTSYKVKTFIGMWSATKSPRGLLNGEMGCQYASTLIRGFHRRLGIPNQTIVTDGLTDQQQALAMALLHSNSPTRPKPRRR